MEKKVVVKFLGRYNGHAIKSNKSVDIGFQSDYDQLVNYIQLIQMLNNDVNIDVRCMKDGQSETFKLGSFRVKEVKVDHDGEGVLKFNSMSDFVESDNLNKMVGADQIMVRAIAMVEVEEEEGEV